MNLFTTTSLTSLHPGKVLDHYRLEGVIASGGMASIFRATDTKTGRPVAVKIPHPDRMGDQLVAERFRRETEIGRRLDHPGLVKMLSIGEAGYRYAVMEWIDGRPLREIILEQEKLPVARAIRITVSLCDVLEYVHARGLVHGDVKPENVLADTADQIKLIDFGIARERKVNFWKRVRSAKGRGTPDFASPEQIRDKLGDTRSDVYSLGIMLFEMLTGEVPFSGLDPQTAMQMRLRFDAPAIREIDMSIPPELELVVTTALARDPANRYSSARELASNLLGFLSQETAEQPMESISQF